MSYEPVDIIIIILTGFVCSSLIIVILTPFVTKMPRSPEQLKYLYQLFAAIMAMLAMYIGSKIN